jgi:hypothetical protein
MNTPTALLPLLLLSCATPGSQSASGASVPTSCPGSEIPVYSDADGDGFGDAGTETLACGAGPGQSELAGDCDDQESKAYPGALDVGCDGIDNDCDGALPQCRRSLADAGAILSGPSDEDRMGYPGFVGDVDGDGLEDIVAGASGKAWLISGPDVPGYAGSADAVATLSITTGWGQYPAPAGDTDGDGLDDFWLGARLVQTGSFGGSASIDITAQAEYVAGSGQGWAVSTPDVDADGLRDYIFETTESLALYMAPFTVEQEPLLIVEDIDCAAGVNTSADLDGDGAVELLFGGVPSWSSCTEDVAIGSFDWDLYSGSVTLRRDTESYEMTLAGAVEATLAEPVGDADGDGYTDLIIADWNRWYMVPGPFNGPVDPGAQALVSFEREDPNFPTANSIEAIGTAGDVDGDGATELLSYNCGDVEQEGDPCQGVLYVIRSGALGALSPVDADAVWEGQISDGVSDNRLASGGDLDLDGVPDLLIGSMSFDDDHPHGGHVYWLSGATLLDGP